MEIIDNTETTTTTTTTTQTRKDAINWTLRIILAALFIVSAIAKLYPSPNLGVNTFIYKQLIPMGFNETLANHFSRVLIGGELALGILLLQKHFFKRLILPVSFLMLLVFSIHLTYESITQNGGNCGCFGELIPMTPFQALIKNIIAMGMIGFVFAKTNRANDGRKAAIPLITVLACALLLYALAPINAKTAINQQTAVVPEPHITPQLANQLPQPSDPKAAVAPAATTDGTAVKETTATAEPVKVEIAEPKKKASGFKQYFADIDNGKKILCFFAPGCEHCQKTVKQLTELKKADADFPAIRIIFMDEEAELIPAFFDIAGAKYPYFVMDIASFWKTLGTTRDTPGVLYLWNGNQVKFYDGTAANEFKKDEFKAIVAKPWEK